ncbi:unnamed protein product [Pleuronectes platessa]|uniref:Uncharacterized protein n=1 Tax=Pleuronectes platessa TaxID=8262 RepID=A0A9N7U271_PLEPL|nr:unnamed protein product [Pleuronectes platessa]
MPSPYGMSAEELSLTLRIRELEVEAMHLRALEMEQGAAAAARPSTTQSPSQTPQDSFDCKLVSKAQEVCTSLSIEDSLNYESVGNRSILTEEPFVSEGSCSLVVGDKQRVSITLLRDTGAMQSLIRGSILPFSAQSYCGWLPGGLHLPEGTAGGGAKVSLIKAGAQVCGEERRTKEWRPPHSREPEKETWTKMLWKGTP